MINFFKKSSYFDTFFFKLNKYKCINHTLVENLSLFSWFDFLIYYFIRAHIRLETPFTLPLSFIRHWLWWGCCWCCWCSIALCFLFSASLVFGFTFQQQGYVASIVDDEFNWNWMIFSNIECTFPLEIYLWVFWKKN